MNGTSPINETSSSFRFRRFENWIILGFLYCFFYLSRYNINSVQALLSTQYGWNNVKFGWFITAATTVYGFAVFLNGPLADKIGGKKTILIGAIGTAIFNLLFGLSNILLVKPAIMKGSEVLTPATFGFGMKETSVLALMISIWACNYYFQSFGALSIVKINSAWFHVKERGRFAGIFGMMIQGGRLLANKLGPLLLAYALPWQYVFYIPSLLLITMFIIGRKRLENSPEQAGFPPYDTGDSSIEEAKEKVSTKAILMHIFAKRATWIIAFTSLCLGMVRHASEGWVVKYLGAVYNVSNKTLHSYGPYTLYAMAAPFAAIIGGFIAGNASDRIFGSRRAPVIFVALICQSILLLILTKYVMVSPWISCILISILAMFIQSAHSLLAGTASMDFGGRKAVSTAAGFFDGAQYLAGAIAGVGLGKLLDLYGYKIWPFVPIPFALLGSLLIATLWNVKPKGSAGH